MKIMVFLHGTVIMHKNAEGRCREERAQQVVDGDPSARDFRSYIPVGNAVNKLRAWHEQGASIVYLSSHTERSKVDLDEQVLVKHGFPDGKIFFRASGQTYAEVAEAVLPDVLVEDDCTSIGGEPEMTHPHLSPAAKARVQSMVVREFGGIDHLPDDPSQLLTVE